MNIKLYGSFTSPYARHCRVALAESDIDFEFVEVDATQSAKLSPMQKVPFLSYTKNGSKQNLTDSSAILRFVRERQGEKFMADIGVFNHYCSVNTLMDTAINCFYLEKDGVTPEKSSYLKRQQARLQTGLSDLNKQAFAQQAPFNDFELRLACLLDWAVYRQRFTLDSYPALAEFLKNIKQYECFVSTAPKG